jgi:hypothetical protein
MEFNKNFEDADAAFEAEDDADLSDSEWFEKSFKI